MYAAAEPIPVFVVCFRVKEEVFWRNYFYRVSLIKQSAQLTALAAQQKAERQATKEAGTNLGAIYQTGKTIVWLFTKNAVVRG